MKRAPELQALSTDHHSGLVLARKAKKAAASKDSLSVQNMWADIEARFETELEPHFKIEESLIVPLLDCQGESQLTQRLYQEHATLRQLLSPDNERTSTNLQHFGELLEKHIRFEERELFEVAQNSLSAEALRAVAKACQASRGST